MQDKILVTIPYWEGDKERAMTLAKLLASAPLQPTHPVDFLFVARADCQHDEEGLASVASRFKVIKHRGTSQKTGWPAGCNGLTFDVFDFWLETLKSPERREDYKAFFFCAPDVIPLSKGCLDYLHTAWEKINKSGKVYWAGALVDNLYLDRRVHVNSDCLLVPPDIEFLSWLTSQRELVPDTWGIDSCLAGALRVRGWRGLPGIRSAWNTTSISEDIFNDLQAHGVVWFHGVKDSSGIELSKKLLI